MESNVVISYTEQKQSDPLIAHLHSGFVPLFEKSNAPIRNCFCPRVCKIYGALEIDAMRNYVKPKK